ncbi:DUF4440 domain-containing protein [Paracidovorax cattleyae]|uniref:DUF4440 domain-containing protein n=1 Tax=Paracidovorax cattleyae TaxID=80868 RepID=A0A1H0V9K4_9BURK|nr:DUF4440 domain-containing protein [Paracidovorax cattleyae]AVS73633.1 DUF4440 domain-containing protein [Paracidovorax cattleyae]MBF9264722.1 DUF4440 domain-containing protein [Paracidovorax cattleyae]SDP75071.1 hypothetical protein SAMN04489708_12449 [Paracidovorax cattleyae]
MYSDDTALLAHLQALETELHRPATRRDAARLGALLHGDFGEIGRSGVAYIKAGVLAQLSLEAAHAYIVAGGFELKRLGAAVALLTCRSAHRMEHGMLQRVTLHAFIWERSGAQWRMRFHQGTPAAASVASLAYLSQFLPPGGS